MIIDIKRRDIIELLCAIKNIIKNIPIRRNQLTYYCRSTNDYELDHKALERLTDEELWSIYEHCREWSDKNE